MAALPKTPLGTAPEAPDLPPVDELAKGLGRLVKRTQARKLRHTPIDKPIRQAAALAHQRKQGQREAQQAQAAKANAQAQRAANTAKLVDTITATRKPHQTPPQGQQAPAQPQQAPNPTPPPQGQPAASQTQQPRYGFRTPPPAPGRQPMQPAAAKPAGQPTGPIIPAPAQPAPIPRQAPGKAGTAQVQKLGAVLQPPANTPRKRSVAARAGMLGGQKPPTPGATTPGATTPGATTPGATTPPATPPATLPATPPQRGDVTPRQRLAERLMAMLKRGEWEGFMRRAGGHEPRRVAEERARAAREANWHRIETQLDDLRRDKE